MIKGNKYVKNLFRISKGIFPIVFLLIPSIASAYTLTERSTGGSIEGFIINIANKILGFTTALAVFFVVYAGVRYITSAGNSDSLESAKKTLTYAIIGLVVVIFSLFIVNFIQGTFYNKLAH